MILTLLFKHFGHIHSIFKRFISFPLFRLGMGLKIGMFLDIFDPYKNGVINSAKYSARALEERGHTVFFYVPSYPRIELPINYSMHGGLDGNVYKIRTAGLRGLGYRQPLHPVHLDPELIEHTRQLDIIHTHHYKTIGKFGRSLARKHRIPCVFTAHTKYEMYSHYFPLLADKQSKEIIRRMVTRH